MKSIVSETDLTYYENKLHDMNCSDNVIPANTKMGNKSFAEHIILQKGKLLKVEMETGNCVKIGILMDVGSDHLCLRVGNAPVSTLIPFCRIRSVTIVHNNNRRNISHY